MADLHTEARVVREHVIAGRTQRDVAADFGVSPSTVSRWVEAHGLESNECNPKVYNNAELLDDLRRTADTLCRTPSQPDYTEHGDFSAFTLIKRFGSWRDACREAGLEPNERTREGVVPRLHEEEWLYKQYVERERSTKHIAGELGCSANAVREALRRNGIERRSRSKHAVYCEALDREVDSRVELSFAEALDAAGMLDDAEYHPYHVETAEGRWEADFEVAGWLVECKNGDVTGAMGAEPYSQAPKMELVDRPVLLYGLHEDMMGLPHDAFVEYTHDRDAPADALEDVLRPSFG